jgi:dihydroneopterin aldolase
MDKITLKNMKFFGYHGVFAEEQANGQNFFIDAELFLDLRAAGKSDDLKDTVDYSEIYDIIKYITIEKRFQLIEKLADCISSEILIKNPLINEVLVRVRKPEAPMNGVLDFAEVEIKRSRNG